MNYPDNFQGTNMDGPDATELDVLFEQHRMALKNVVLFAFQQWPHRSHVLYRRALIDSAATTAQVALEQYVNLSKQKNAIATDERLSYHDANRDMEPDAVIQCLESMLSVYESAREEAA